MFRCIAIGFMALFALWSGALSADAKDGLYVHLLPAQSALLQSKYPGFAAIRTCPGRFGALSTHDAVAGIVLMNGAYRVGFIWDGSKWTIHDIDAETEQDSEATDSSPGGWIGNIGGDAADDFRCGFKLGKDARIGIEGDKPLFDLKKLGLEKSTVVCFATDSTYNNWDCVVYSPKDKRFRLWFRQAHAD